MKVLYVPSAIRKPFAFIDQAIVQAMKKIGFDVYIIRPGPSFEAQWEKIKNKHKLDFLLAMLGERLTYENLQLIQALPFPKAIWYTDDPYAIDQAIKSCSYFDFIFTNESRAVPVYQKKCRASVFHFALGAPRFPYIPLKQVDYHYRSHLILVGCAFQNRLQTIRKLLPFLQQHRTRLIGPGWDQLSVKKSLYIRNHWVEAKEVCKYYNGAQIVLNVHRSYDDPYLKQNRGKVQADTPNNRLFEIAACASFQLLDYRPDIEKYYQVGKEIITYSDENELKEKISFFLPREQLRKKIAIQSYRRTMREHLYEHRLKQMVQTIFRS